MWGKDRIKIREMRIGRRGIYESGANAVDHINVSLV